MDILIQSGNTRIIRDDDSSLAPQRLENGSWQYEYYQDGSPVVVPDTAACLEECENWAGVWVNTSLNPELRNYRYV